jgi:hypothetical protein
MKNLFLTILIAGFGLTLSAQTTLRQKTQEEKLNDAFCTGLFKTTEGTVLDVYGSNTAHAYFNILDWLDGRVAGLQVVKGKNGVRVPLIRGQQPAIFLDEVQTNLSAISSIATSDIAIIKIIKTPFVGGFNAGGGAIAIYTGSWEDDGADPDGEGK